MGLRSVEDVRMSETKFTPGPWECKQVPTSSGRAFRIGKGGVQPHDAVKRVLGQKAYTLDLQNTANHTKWDVYNRIKNADRALFDWECSSQQTDCYGRPKTDSSKKPDHFGQAFYYRTDAVWRYQSPKNTP